jgi:SAM-dependent methyltransferase
MSLREADIRPADLMAGQKTALEADIAWLHDRQSQFVRVDCPACGLKYRRLTFEKRGLVYQRCRSCDTLYMNPRPSPKLLDEFYRQARNYAYWAQHIFPASDGAREMIARQRTIRIANLTRRTGTLLEVGAGAGTFCEMVRRYKLFNRVIAVEPTPDLAAVCRAHGIETIETPIEHVHLDDPVDVIAAFEVIEHLFSPPAFIEHCAGLLAPGGLLALTCPNAYGFDVLELGVESDTIDHEHLNYFHPESLSRLVRAYGLEVLEVSTPGRLDAEIVRKHALAGGTVSPFLRRILVDEWDRVGDSFQRWLSENRLSSHMWLVARKP